MFNFDEAKVLQEHKNGLSIVGATEKAVDEVVKRGYKNIFYIGIGNFAEKTGSVPLIYDWRAPVSSLFYDYDGGPASYLAPAGQMDGLIKSKWQYKVKHG